MYGRIWRTGGMALLAALQIVARDGDAQAQASRRLNAGLWESVTTMNGRAMPPGRICIGARDAADINGGDAAVRAGLARTNGADGCKVAAVRIAGDTIAFDSLCRGSTARTTITYRGDSYAGSIAMRGVPAMSLKARRIGTIRSRPLIAC